MIDESNSLKLSKIRSSQHFCCIELASDYDYVWTVKLIRCGGDHKDFDYISKSHEELNDAITDIYDQVKDMV